jgi:hypothetical protein
MNGLFHATVLPCPPEPGTARNPGVVAKKWEQAANAYSHSVRLSQGLGWNNATLLSIRIVAAILTERLNHDVVDALIKFLKNLKGLPCFNTLFVVVAINAASCQSLGPNLFYFAMIGSHGNQPKEIRVIPSIVGRQNAGPESLQELFICVKKYYRAAALERPDTLNLL